MLGVVARLAPHDRRGDPFNGLTVLGDGLAVALHLELLEVSWKALQPIVVRQHGVRRQIQEADVLDIHETDERGQVGVPGGGPEMLVHFVAAGQEAIEILLPDGNGQ